MSTFYIIHLKWGPDIVSLQMWSADEETKILISDERSGTLTQDGVW